MQKKILKMNEKYLEKLIEDLNQFDEFWNEKILRDEFKNENSEYFVLVNEDDELCAFAGLWFNIDEAHVMNVAVRKNFRNNGLGSEFMKFLIDRAKQKEKVCITLEVREDNIPAIALYKKCMFEEVGRRKKYYNKLIDGIIMTRYFKNT